MIKYMAMTIGFLLILMGLIRSLYFIPAVCCDPFISWDVLELLSSIIFTVIGFLSFGMTIFFPNLFLIILSQLIVVYHLYLEVKVRHHDHSNGIMLQDYLDNIPDTMMALLEGENKLILSVDEC